MLILNLFIQYTGHFIFIFTSMMYCYVDCRYSNNEIFLSLKLFEFLNLIIWNFDFFLFSFYAVNFKTDFVLRCYFENIFIFALC